MSEPSLTTFSDLLSALNQKTVETQTNVTAVSDLVQGLDYVKSVNYNGSNGDLTFTFETGAALTVNVLADNLAQNIEYEAATKELKVTRQDGSSFRLPLVDLVDVYTGAEGTQINVEIDSGNVVRAVLRNASVTETHLANALAGKINDKLGKTEQAASAATALQLTNARTLSVNDNATTGASFNGTADVSIGVPVTVAAGTAANTLPSTSQVSLRAWLATARNCLAWLATQVGLKANIASPAFTGTPTAPSYTTTHTAPPTDTTSLQNIVNLNTALRNFKRLGLLASAGTNPTDFNDVVTPGTYALANAAGATIAAIPNAPPLTFVSTNVRVVLHVSVLQAGCTIQQLECVSADPASTVEIWIRARRSTVATNWTVWSPLHSAPVATRTANGVVTATSPDGVGTTTLGTTAIVHNRAVSFNMMGNAVRDLNDYRTPGEWYFYNASHTNQPPFTGGSVGVYLKVLMGYSTTNCIQLCWRRASSDMWIRHSTSATAWTAWKRFATTDDVPKTYRFYWSNGTGGLSGGVIWSTGYSMVGYFTTKQQMPAVMTAAEFINWLRSIGATASTRGMLISGEQTYNQGSELTQNSLYSCVWVHPTENRIYLGNRINLFTNGPATPFTFEPSTMFHEVTWTEVG